MNIKFNFKRLLLLLQRYFLENWRREIMFWGILVLIFTILDQRDFVIIVLFLSGIYYSLRLHKELSNGISGMHFLLIPATHTEKLTATLILNTLYHFGMIVLTYSIGNLLIILIYHQILKLEVPVNWDLFQKTSNVEINGVYQISVQNVFWKIWGLFAFVQAVFTLGSLYFKRNTVIKTTFCIISFGVLLMLVQIILFKTIWEVKYMRNAIFPIIAMINDSTIPTLIDNAVKYGSLLMLPFLWFVSYFRLTEKEM